MVVGGAVVVVVVVVVVTGTVVVVVVVVVGGTVVVVVVVLVVVVVGGGGVHVEKAVPSIRTVFTSKRQHGVPVMRGMVKAPLPVLLEPIRFPDRFGDPVPEQAENGVPEGRTVLRPIRQQGLDPSRATTVGSLPELSVTSKSPAAALVFW